jgi:exopolysaccharide biosynthesis polyprenyl glycosylphosphotransferase
MGAVPCLGKISDLRAVVAAQNPERIVVGMAERRARLPVYDLLDLRLSGIHVEEAAALYESCFGRVSTRDLRPSQLVFSSELGPSPNSVAIQQIYSFLVALIGGIVALPLMLLAALLVRLTSKGPVLYRQTRVGLNGKHISVLKFRSMFVDAEARTGAVWASKNDPRITGIGKYLRKFRIDELPQFWNVLRGDMSFVGPRPERPEFVQALSEKIPFYRQRHCVKPGLTGWAQINHKYGDTIEDTITKLEYDLYYIKHISVSLDMYIILNTLKTVLLGRGAQ